MYIGSAFKTIQLKRTIKIVRFSLLSCDQCERLFCKSISKEIAKERTLTCSRECQHQSQRCGKLRHKKESLFIERYGVKNPFQSEIIKEKCRSTLITNLGVDNPAKSDSIKLKMKKTCFDKYGVNHPTKHSDVVQKRALTNIERYGTTCTLQNEDVKNKARRTMLNRYGVEHNFLMDDYHRNVKNTMIERYGVSNAYQLPDVKAKACSQIAREKSHRTMKERGTYRKSSVEDALYEKLIAMYGVENVKRQILVNSKWPIDFYVATIDTYVQYDGAYWHGLDRSLNDIINSSSERDKVIYKKWLTDRMQERWFAENNMLLKRLSLNKSQIIKMNVEDLKLLLEVCN